MKVFISYARDDANTVEKIAEDLRQRGDEVWTDRGRLLAGQRWPEEIVQGIQGCDCFLLILSRHSLESDAVVRELQLAYERAKRIVPLRLDQTPVPEAMAFQLSGLHYVSYAGSIESVFGGVAAQLPQDERGRMEVEGVEFVRIEGGEFKMGAANDDPEAYFQEKGAHTVDVTPYWIAKYPTTLAQFARFLDAEGRNRPSGWDIDGAKGWLPIRVDAFADSHRIDLNDIREYCTWLSRRARAAQVHLREPGIQLTSEAEWEFAARGTEGRRYPWVVGGPDREHAQYGSNAPCPVNGHPKGDTPDGVCDMAGNVFELCRDKHTHVVEYRQGSRLTDPVENSGSTWALRGCDYRMPASMLRATYRLGYGAREVSMASYVLDKLGVLLTATPRVGFRCAFRVH